MNQLRRALPAKNTIPNGIVCIFMTGFCVGMVFFYLSDKAFAKGTGLFNETDILLLAGMDADRDGLLGYVVVQRLRQFAVLLLCAACRFRKLLLWGLVGLAGVMLSIFIFTAVYRVGIVGLFLSLLLLFPHGIFYLLLLGRMLALCHVSDTTYYHKVSHIKQVQEGLLIFLLLAFGILCETYVSPFFVQKIASLL